LNERYLVHGIKKCLAENSNLKIITGERAIVGTWYYRNLDQNSNLKIITGGRAIGGTCY